MLDQEERRDGVKSSNPARGARFDRIDALCIIVFFHADLEDGSLSEVGLISLELKVVE